MGWRHNKTAIVCYLLPVLLAGGFFLLINNAGIEQDSKKVSALYDNQKLTPATPNPASQTLEKSNFDDTNAEYVSWVHYEDAVNYQYLRVSYLLPTDKIITGIRLWHHESGGSGPYSIRSRVIGDSATKTNTFSVSASSGGNWYTYNFARSTYIIDNDPYIQLETSVDDDTDCLKVGGDTPSWGDSYYDVDGAGFVLDTNKEYMITALYEDIITLNPGESDGDTLGSPHNVDAYYVTLTGGRNYLFTLSLVSGTGDLNMRLVPFTSGGITGDAVKSTSGSSYPEYMSYTPASTSSYILIVEPATSSENAEYLVSYTEQLPPDDSYEENDFQNTAKAITVGTYTGLVCEDDDWYNITIATGTTITVDTYFTHSTGDLDLSLYNSTGQVNVSQSYSDHERVSFTALSTGNHSIRVYRYGSTTFNYYNMTISVTSPPDVDDTYEENDVQSMATILIAGNYLNLNCKDDDWYNVSVTVGYTVRADIFFQNSIGDLNLALYYPVTLRNWSTGTTDHEVVSWIAASTGLYSIRVYKAGASNNHYNLTIAIIPPSGDDAFEDNDLQSQAWPISTGTYNSLVCGDDDWFNITVTAGSTLYVDIYFSQSVADLDLQLYNASGLLNSSAGVTDHEGVSFKSLVTSPYSFRIFRYWNYQSPNSYNMIISIFTPAVDDNYEENDVIEDAKYTSPGVYPSLISRYGDYDWYYLSVSAGNTLTVDITFNHLIADLDLYLYDTLGIEVNRSASASQDIEIVSYKVTSGGYYYIRVLNYYGSPNTYTMTITVGQTSGDDGFEENDVFSSAAYIAPGTYPSLVCANDDWFYVSGFAGATITINMSFTNSIADLNLVLYSSNLQLLNSSTSTSNNFEIVSFAVLTSGNYYFLIYWQSGALSSNYDLSVSSEGGDDIYEENDLSSSASLITSGLFESLLCADNDWYKIWVDQWVNITITIYFTNAQGNLDLTLYFEDSLRAHSVTQGNGESLFYTVRTAGYHYIKVFKGSSFGSNIYSMKVQLSSKGTRPPDSPSESIAGFDVIFLLGVLLGTVFILSKKNFKRVK